MYSLLLVIIYVAFISLGLPDSLLGAGWPVMQQSLNVPLSYAGIITMLISVFTIVSSLFCSKIVARIGSGMFTAVSVTLTALAMLAFSFADRFWIMLLLTVPYGLGAGGVDATLNNFVALHYKARHMSWLHCFWGIGAIISPYIMGLCLSTNSGWQWGYRTVGIIQIILAAVMFISLPLWKKKESREVVEEIKEKALTFKEIFRIKGVILWMVVFFCYCALEQVTMVWAGSYLSVHKLLDADKAAFFSSFVFIGLTLGRFICGFLSEKAGDRRLIRIGYCVIISGLVFIAIPVKNVVLALIGFFITGLGCAPIYPCIIHATPDNFGKENSQSIIGVQMACAYTGVTFMPPLFGIIAEKVSIGLLPICVFALVLILIICFEIFIRKKSAEIKKIEEK